MKDNSHGIKTMQTHFGLNQLYTVYTASSQHVVYLTSIPVQSCLPQPPDSSFVKKVVSSKPSVSNETDTSSHKKVFIKFVQGPFTF